MRNMYQEEQAAYYQQAMTGQPYPMGYEYPEMHGLQDDLLALTQDDSFQKNLQFGIIDNGLLVAMTLAGLSLEDRIADAVGVKGYGAIMGATIGNAISDGAAALPQGYKAAAGVTLGCLLPVIPLGVAMAMGKEVKGQTRNVLFASSAALLAYAFLSPKLKSAAQSSMV